MNSPHTVITPQHESFSPAAGWLSKMVSLPFKRTCWISRYFVLLDSELRFYKDEHSETSSQVLNLRQIAHAIPAPTFQHPFCFRLEPKQRQKEHALKPWIIECKSEIDMEAWVCAIQSRIMKYSPASSPILPTTAQFMPNPTLSNATVESVIMTSPTKVCRVMLPLRCTNIIRGEQGESLLSRRNKNLAPIVTQPTPCSPHQPSLPLYSSSLSSTSSTSTLSPPSTSAVLGSSLLISPGIIDRYSNYTSKDNNQTALLVTQGFLGVQHHQEKKQCDTISLESSSPTYLMYKKRFHL